VKNVWQQYADQVVLEGLNLNINEGEFCTLVGASGCGKSTFLRLLLGQERASRGEILLDGQPLAGEPDASRGVVFQRYSVFPHLSVLDNVALGLELPRSPLFGRLFGSAKKRPANRLRCCCTSRPRPLAGQVPGAALRWHAATLGHRPGVGHEAARVAAR
jgi:ABC-type sugar transport system ATPase subunit